jgi:hypothetical protein
MQNRNGEENKEAQIAVVKPMKAQLQRHAALGPVTSGK